MTGGRSYITLLELNLMIRNVIENHLDPSYWVAGEISEMSEARSGHCYLELVEKNEGSEQPVAKSRATIWAATYKMLKPYFEKATGQELGAGIKILVKVNVRYHEQYGLSLTVTDIEPAFTLGDIELKRQETIQKLKNEGIFDLNKQLKIDPFSTNIAIISSPTAAGYGDFVNQLYTNIPGFRFHTVLFPAYMQGNDAVESMIKAMEKAYKYTEIFHAVVIIRGGGSRSELACFDSYELASHICQFPLPVLSGIGHERDVSVVDMVSHSRFKTPTATAQFLIDNIETSITNIENAADDIFNIAEEITQQAKVNFRNAAARMLNASRYSLDIAQIRLRNFYNSLHKVSRYNLSSNSSKLKQAFSGIRHHSGRMLAGNKKQLASCSEKIGPSVLRTVSRSALQIEMFKRICEANSPEKIIKKGFSVTRVNGRSLKKAAGIKKDDILETRLSDGRILSKVETIIPEI